MKMISKHTNEILSNNFDGTLIVFNSRDLILVAGVNQCTKFYIENEKPYTSSYHLGHFKDLIDRCKLEKVHRSFFINIYKVRKYERSDETILMSNNEKVPLSKTNKLRFLKRLGQ